LEESDVVGNVPDYSWHEVKKVDHYWLSVDAVRDPMRVREEPPSLESDHQ
jgi:hypothetical protein